MSNGTTYRRGSVFWALLLIALGGLFLYSNIQTGFSPWPLLARFWPVLIIVWGLGKLVDYVVLRGQPDGAAATRLSGAEIFGLILLLLFGSLFSLAVTHLRRIPHENIRIGGEEVACLIGSEYEFSDERTQTAAALPTTLSLSNTGGDATVTAVAGNQIRVVARKKVCAASDAEAHRVAREFEPVLEPTGEGYEFRWKTTAGAVESLRADLELQVPRQANLRLTTRRGDVQVKGVEGNVELNVNRGDVRVENVLGDVSVKLGRGDARLVEVGGAARVEGRGGEVYFRNIRGGASLDGEYSRPLQFVGVSGPVRFTSRRTTFSAARIDGELTLDSGRLALRGVPGEVTLLTRDKDITVEDVTGAVQIENRNGPVVLRFHTPPTHDIQVENHSADIELYLPANSGFELHASARDGEIESDFTGSALNRQKEERGAEVLSGTYGTRRASLQLSTSYGTIHLRRATAGTPPTSPTR